MAKFRMKVLLLEQHNVLGGFTSSFVRGGFEFETALHELKGLEIKITKVMFIRCLKNLKLTN